MVRPARPAVPVLIALGANLGDRLAMLRAAVAALAPEVEVDAVSSVYETAPMYLTDQGAFLNMAVAGRTALAPHALLDRLKALEAALGRVPTVRNGPRAIDLDILLYADRTLADDRLQVPHPRMGERGFVLVPAAEIAAGWVHPVEGATLAGLLDRLGPVRDVVAVAGPDAVRGDAAA